MSHRRKKLVSKIVVVLNGHVIRAYDRWLYGCPIKSMLQRQVCGGNFETMTGAQPGTIIEFICSFVHLFIAVVESREFLMPVVQPVQPECCPDKLFYVRARFGSRKKSGVFEGQQWRISWQAMF